MAEKTIRAKMMDLYKEFDSQIRKLQNECDHWDYSKPHDPYTYCPNCFLRTKKI